MTDQRFDSTAVPTIVSTVAVARLLRRRSRLIRETAARTRWCARKERLRTQRLKRKFDGLLTPQLDDFVEIASVDDLVDVLVLLADRGGDRGTPTG